jgi:hypothetical protein
MNTQRLEKWIKIYSRISLEENKKEILKIIIKEAKAGAFD